MGTTIVRAMLVIFFASVSAFATPQIPDILVYEGREYPIRAEILDDYFKRFPQRNPKPADDWCSALWRGYLARFETVDGRIFLKDIFINVCSSSSSTSALEKVVPNGERLFVDWYSDLLDSGYGENAEDPYSLESFEAYENYTFFEVEKGTIRKVKHFNNKEYRTFKKRQFEAYKKTKDYASTSRKMLEDRPRMTKSDVETYIQDSIFFYTKTFLVK